MLSLSDLTFSIAGKPLFRGASAQIPAGARVGVVGRNGSGKTTLLRLIRGELTPDGGAISMLARARIGTVAQEAPGDSRSLIDTVLAADTERAALVAEAETATDPPASPRSRPGSPISAPIRPRPGRRRSSPASASTTPPRHA